MIYNQIIFDSIMASFVVYSVPTDGLHKLTLTPTATHCNLVTLYGGLTLRQFWLG